MIQASNLKVFRLFRTLECVCSLACFGTHLNCVFNSNENYPHDVLFCGTFIAFSIISFLAIVYQASGSIDFVMEAISAGIAYVLFTTASIWTMALAEQDEHLTYITEMEEMSHPFFWNSRMQSVAALIGSFTFLLHFIFSIDYLMHKSTNILVIDDPRLVLFQRNIPVRLELYFFPELLWYGLKRLAQQIKIFLGNLSCRS